MAMISLPSSGLVSSCSPCGVIGELLKQMSLTLRALRVDVRGRFLGPALMGSVVKS